jgi:hypothetical protein
LPPVKASNTHKLAKLLGAPPSKAADLRKQAKLLKAPPITVKARKDSARKMSKKPSHKNQTNTCHEGTKIRIDLMLCHNCR